MLLARDQEPVNPPSHCEQTVHRSGITQAKLPTHMVIRWRGAGAPTVQEFVGHDVTFAYIMAEGMAGLRDGDTVILYAVHWSTALWGRA